MSEISTNSDSSSIQSQESELSYIAKWLSLVELEQEAFSEEDNKLMSTTLKELIKKGNAVTCQISSA
jgi:hypothetical protein